MELILLSKDRDYCGSVDFKDREVAPEVVVFGQDAYVIDHSGVRSGGVPRYVRANTLVITKILTGAEMLERYPTKKRLGRSGRGQR